MKQKTLVLSSLVSASLLLPAGYVLAAEQESAREEIQAPKQQQIYGSQLMTQQERTEYRNKMRTAKSAEEQEQIRHEHHEQMKERAKARGMTLPDEPPARGSGMGGGGMGGGGMGGGGMGGGGMGGGGMGGGGMGGGRGR